MRVRTLALPVLCLSACSDQGVKAYNNTPEALITSHTDGDTLREGYAETLVATVTDANHTPDELLATWTLDGESVLDCVDLVPGTDGSVSCEVDFAPGSVAAMVLVRDPQNATGTATVTLEVVATDAPTAEVLQPVTDGQYYSDHPVTLEGLVGDGEDAIEDLVVSWESSVDGPLAGATPDADGLASGSVSLTEGDHVITLSVVDTSGKEARDSVAIAVGPVNSAPSCVITAPPSGSAGAAGETVVFSALAEDADIDNRDLLVEWSSDKDGDIGTSTANSDGTVTFPTSTLSVETHTITLTVTDEVGASCATSTLYTVGTAPTLVVTAPTDGDVANEGEAVAFAATVSDGEDGPSSILLSWESDIDGEFSTQGADATGAVAFSASGFTAGPHTLTVTATDTDGLSAQQTLVLTINQVPTAPTVTLTPDPAYTTDTLTASASGSVDPDASGTVTYGYAWYVDGTLSSVSTSATFPSSDTQKDSEYRVVVTPTDGTGDGPTAEAMLTVQNSAPVLSGPTLSASTVQVGDVLTCAGSATDVDASDTPTVTYTWSDGSTGATYAVTSADDPGDVITCTATADDLDGGTDSATVSATVANTSPVLSGVSVTPSTGQVGDVLTCSASATDADGGTPALTYTWTDGSTGSTYTIASSDDPGDVITCTVVASDADGGSDTASASATVTNTAPVLSGVSVTPSTGQVGDVLTCSASATDADGGTPTVTYTWTGGATGATYTVTASDDPGDVLTCTVTASDSDGGSDTGSASATVLNTAPVLSGVSVTPSTGQVGDVLTCSGSATDADGGTPTVTYAWSGGSTGSTYTIASSDDPGDVITCTVVASDTDGGTDTASASATVANTAPVLSGVSVTPSTGQVGDVLTCSGSATDADGDTPTLTYAWSGGATGSTYAITASDDPGDVLTCTVTASDTDGGSDSGSASATVLNSDPVVSSVSITPDPANNDDTLTCTVVATDADGDTPSVAVTWTNTTTGSVLGSSTSVSLSSATASSLDTIRCSVSISDPDGGTDSGSASVTLDNREPTISGVVSLTPATPSVSDTLTCAATGVDDDGDTVTLSYAWTVGATSSGTGTTLSGVFSAGDVVTCTVTPDDGKGASSGTASSASVTIQNTAPTLSSVTLTPSGPRTNDTLTANGSTSDADGDAVTIQWDFYVGSTLVQSGSSSTLSGVSWFDKNDTVYVVGTPSDGTTPGSEVTSSTVTVLNTAPGAPSVSLSPTAPAEGVDDLLCSVDVASGDDDADTVTYSAAWTVNGTAFSGTGTTVFTGDTVFASDTTAGDVWVCVVTPNDGDDDGATDSATVTVDSSLDDLIVDGTTETLSTGTYAYDEVQVINGGTLVIDGVVELDANSFYVEIGATVDGDGEGAAGGALNAAGLGTGGGGRSSTGGGGGGGYGGTGGRGGYDSGDSPGAGGSAYGSSSSTSIFEGSGGGSTDSTRGGAGGGAVAVTAADIIVDGTISMDGIAGAGGTGRNAGGGSGGGVLLIGDSVEVTGTITATGGRGGSGSSTANDGGGGGGGGRIKIFYDTGLTLTGSLSVTGGGGGTYGSVANGASGSPGSTHTAVLAFP